METSDERSAAPADAGRMGEALEADLIALVREIMDPTRAQAEPDVFERSLAELGVASLGALTLQYQLDARFGVLVSLDFLLSADSVRTIAGAVTARQAPTSVVTEVLL